MMLPDSVRLPLARVRRSLCEAVGVARYSRPALHELDRKLERYLDFDDGFFIEAGANDGFTQSNTYYFERMRRWMGILVEPVPELAERCRRLRRRSRVVQAALVSADHAGDEIEMEYAGLMSVTADAFGDGRERRAHVTKALERKWAERTYTLRVPAATLSEILDSHAGEREIDLLSLDVEGAELAALSGLDMTRHVPRHICVEARDPAAVTAMLSPRYEFVAALFDSGEHQDMFFRRR